MGSPYVGELRLVGFNFGPEGWFQCQGQLLSIAQYEVLFALIGTNYGGDGVNTFGLPDLRGRVPVHQGSLSGGSSYVIGQIGGTETVTITLNQIPSHSHSAAVAASAQTTSVSPSGNILCQGTDIYGSQVPVDAMAPNMVSNTGNSLPHSNIQPFLALNWIIAWSGIFPTQS